MMAGKFGTDGVRGVVNCELTCSLAYRIAGAAADMLKELHHGYVVIGRDTRLSGPMLEAAMSAGFMERGVSVVSAGVIPTPAIACLVPQTGAGAGVMITASHNSAEYNGVKLFGADGRKLPDNTEAAIEARIGSNESTGKASCDQIGRLEQNSHLCTLYTSHLLSSVPDAFRPMRIVLDCANGAAAGIAPALFASIGMDVTAMAAEPDGMNINLCCGSTDTEALRSLVLSAEADAGFAFDGDGDRLIAVDEKGREVDGDEIICMCALYMAEKGMLRGHAVAGTVMSNMGLELTLKQRGISLLRTAVGDRYVLEAMAARGLSLGGEQSGHIVFADHANTGDGMLTALQVLRVMSETGMPLSRLAAQMERTPQFVCSARVPKEKHQACLDDASVSREIQRIRQAYEGKGRLLVRPSGTEPAIRIMAEHLEAERAQMDAGRLKALLETLAE